MNEYELTVLLTPDLAEKERDHEMKNLQTLLEKAGAKIKSKTDPIKKTLAYEIRKFREASYVFWELTIKPESVKSIEDALKVSDKVMRFMLVRENLKQEALGGKPKGK